jgi:hypothetical protein
VLTNRLPTAAGLAVLVALGCTGDGVDGDGPPGRTARAEVAAERPDGPLSPGGRLARELGCGACHASLPAPDTIRQRAPAFGDGVSRYILRRHPNRHNPHRVMGWQRDVINK